MTRLEVIGSIVVALFLGAIVLGIFFPFGTSIDRSRKAQAKNDVTQIATAVTAFATEYGHLPSMPTNGLVGGDILSALVGSNQTLNPRNIQFIEIGIAKKGKSGLRDGTFVDPWGGPYRIAISANTDIPLIVGTNHIELRRRSIAVWNAPSLQPDSASLSEAKKNRRYVTSWD